MFMNDVYLMEIRFYHLDKKAVKGACSKEKNSHRYVFVKMKMATLLPSKSRD